MSMTLVEMRDKLRKQLGETTASFWSDNELTKWINDVQVDVAFRTRCIRKSGTATSVEGKIEYTATDLFSDILIFRRVYFKAEGTTFKKLNSISKEELDRDHDGWLSASNSTPNWYEHDREDDSFILFPPANSLNAGAGFIKAYYVFRPTVLAANADVSDLPEELHDTVVEGAKVPAWNSRGEGDRANNAKTIYTNGISDYITLRELEMDEEIIMVPETM